jgi:hypothetical protein
MSTKGVHFVVIVALLPLASPLTTKTCANRHVTTVAVTVATWADRHVVKRTTPLNVLAMCPNDHVAIWTRGISARGNMAAWY